MIIYVDIDETICTNSENARYDLATPIKENINKINELYENGNTIVYWTARGTTTGINWSEITKRQFEDWGVKYHDLKFGKPFYDLFICDKSINADLFFGENNAD